MKKPIMRRIIIIIVTLIILMIVAWFAEMFMGPVRISMYGYTTRTENGFANVDGFRRDTPFIDFLIFFLGTTMIYLAIVDIIALRKKNIYSESELVNLKNSMRNQQVEQTLADCRKNKTSLSKIVEESLLTDPAENETQADFIAVIDANAEKAIWKILRKPNKYLFIGIIALLFGAYDAITQMINAFSQWGETSKLWDIALLMEHTLPNIRVGIVVLIIGVLLFFIIRDKANYNALELKVAHKRLTAGLNETAVVEENREG